MAGARAAAAARRYRVEPATTLPNDLAPLLIGRDAAAGHRSPTWMEWMLAHDFDDLPSRRKALFVVRDLADGQVLGYFLIKARFFARATQRDIRDVTIGSVQDWIGVAPDRLSDATLVWMAVDTALAFGVDAVEVCTANASLRRPWRAPACCVRAHWISYSALRRARRSPPPNGATRGAGGCDRPKATISSPERRPSVRFIIGADDFGFSDHTVDRTIACFEDGAMTGASIMARMPATERAASWARAHPEFSYGVHLCFSTDEVERPVLPAEDIPSLVDSEGRFLGSNTMRWRGLLGRLPAMEIAREAAAQIARVRDLGVTPCYIDLHGHLHKLAPFRAALAAVLPRFGIRCVRAAQTVYLKPRRTGSARTGHVPSPAGS